MHEDVLRSTSVAIPKCASDSFSIAGWVGGRRRLILAIESPCLLEESWVTHILNFIHFGIFHYGFNYHYMLSIEFFGTVDVVTDFWSCK